MRCKVGDVVMVVKSTFPENIGKIGTIKAPSSDWAPNADWLCHFPSKLRSFSKEGPIIMNDNVNFADARLQPIRDNDGEDEVLRLVGKPNEVPVATRSNADTLSPQRASKEKANEQAWLEQFN